MEILFDKIKGLLPSQRLLLVVKSYLVMSVPLFKVAHKLLIYNVMTIFVLLTRYCACCKKVVLHVYTLMFEMLNVAIFVNRLLLIY